MGVLDASELTEGTEGEMVEVAFGDSTVRMTWLGDGWRSRSINLFTQRDGDAMDTSGGAAGVWRYVSVPRDTSAMSSALGETLRGSRPWGWNPRAIRDADAGFAGGMTLETRLASNQWAFAADTSFSLGLVMYPLGPGDQISPEIVPDDYVVNILDTGAPTVRNFHSGPWTAWPIDAPTESLLAPHLYARYNSGSSAGSYLEYVAATARWVHHG